MNIDVKQFIEKNIELIEHEAWDDLYDQANEWLLDSSIRELNSILTDVLDIDVEQFAKENAMKHLAMELMNFKAEKTMHNIYFPSFVEHFMQTVNGLDFDEFQLMAENYIKGDKDLIIQHDGHGDLYLQKVRKI